MTVEPVSALRELLIAYRQQIGLIDPNHETALTTRAHNAIVTHDALVTALSRIADTCDGAGRPKGTFNPRLCAESAVRIARATLAKVKP